MSKARLVARSLAAVLLLFAAAPSLFAAETLSTTQLIELSRKRAAGLEAAIEASFDSKELDSGSAWSGHSSDLFFALRSKAAPRLFIDGVAGPRLRRTGKDLWQAAARVEPAGRLHSFYYIVNGAKFGGRNDLPVYGPLSYLQPGVPSGKLSEKIVHTSRIFDGMKSNYWIYVPAQYDARVPAALMVFQDGEGYSRRDGSTTLNVLDNLIAQKKIPVMIAVFVDPGDISGAPGTPTYKFVKAYSEKWNRTLEDSMRSTLYDTVSDRYARYLRDEILAEVESRYNVRKDAYSRAITGLSSGGICSFNAAWQMPEQFSRVLTWIGSFTSIQWKEDPAISDGGQDYPEKVLREPRRNIRVWMQDGSDDLEWNQYGSWAMANIRMANALKLKEYDFHFSFGPGAHNTAHGEVQLPEALTWLWRDYDPAKKEQRYEIEPAEKLKPPFRVSIANRQAE